MTNNRKIHLEILRIIACFLVLYNHTSKDLFLMEDWCFSKTNYLSMIFYFFCKTAVPVFLMVSGSNLLKRNEPASKHIKRILRMLIITVGVSVLYCIYYGYPLKPRSLVSHIFSDFASTALWYLYLYMSILIMLPVLQQLRLNKQHYIYLFFITLFGHSLFPYLNHYYNTPIPQQYLTSTFFSTYLVLFLLGDGIENHLTETDFSVKHIALACLAVIAALAFSWIPAIYQIKNTGEFILSYAYDKNYYLPTFLLSCALFYLARCLGRYELPYILNKIITKISSCTFVIFLSGDLLIDYFKELLVTLKVHMEVNDFIATILFDLFIFLLGMILALLIQSVKSVITMLHKKYILSRSGSQTTEVSESL